MRPVTGRIRLVLGLRKGGITDTRVLAAMEQVPREVFVPETFRDRAYDATALPIGHHQTVSEPLVVARMTQALEVGERHKVLEIGTGSGYQSMVLARLCRRLYTIERHPELLRDAEARFAHLRLTNITSQVGDGTLGWPGQAPFDRIMVTAAAAAVRRRGRSARRRRRTAAAPTAPALQRPTRRARRCGTRARARSGSPPSSPPSTTRPPR
ncbi:MAG: protein-L-isoaspartate(D-aspartate) O-methyltransferase, partial [Rhodospirillales bacterium]|nr:protein-L-isoaspartate(D-aspartate) O-methyltransferase [Rhodospirillales bacterium]